MGGKTVADGFVGTEDIFAAAFVQGEVQDYSCGYESGIVGAGALDQYSGDDGRDYAGDVPGEVEEACPHADLAFRRDARQQGIEVARGKPHERCRSDHQDGGRVAGGAPRHQQHHAGEEGERDDRLAAAAFVATERDEAVGDPAAERLAHGEDRERKSRGGAGVPASCGAVRPGSPAATSPADTSSNRNRCGRGTCPAGCGQA